ncbi:aminopeptidase [Natrialba sp. PRR66]|uniref:aminopeptidase n=1 Tax=Natrialba sp. PRR66 TaxID=3098146 RepID=UPI002B1E01EA|nr:aminopeptidase [Natrialba sp. PRR66]
MVTTQLIETAATLLRTNLAAKPGESFLVVADEPKREIGQAFFEAGREMGLEAGFVEMLPREQHGQEPPEYVSAAMAAADLVICPTSTSLTHTRGRETAVAQGTRVATMPGITKEMFDSGAITADYTEVERLTERMTEKLTAAETARIESHGEQLSLSISGRDGIASDGIFREAGASGNLPSGEGYVAPVEGSAEGTLVVDGGIVGVGVVEDPLSIDIEDGSIVSMHGDHADTFRETIGDDACAKRVCELGIGTNPTAEIVGTVLEDEKVYGTCHVAFGDNAGFGGTIECDSHVDGIVREPDVYLDQECVVNGGELQL